MSDIRTSALGGVPFGTSLTRPASPQIGQTYYNGTLGVQEIYTSSGWLPATGANDFNVTLSGTVTTATFTKEYFAGAYTINSALVDSTYDIYVYDTQGNNVGYTKSPSLTATGNFNKIVVVGGTSGDLLSFSYKTTFTASNTTSEITAGPFISSLSKTVLADINSSLDISGGNFATNVAVSFTGTNYASTPAKSVVRNSSSSLTITRPDIFPPSGNPYTITVINPSVTNQPTGSNLNIYSGVTAGVVPTWNTIAQSFFYPYGQSFTTTLLASDLDVNGSITYSINSGSLPSGLSLNSSTGVVSGTSTAAKSSIVVRATDSGGNYADKSFEFIPTLPTVSGTLLWWYDLADTSSYTVSGGNVTSITDKSGNGRNATAQVTVPLESAKINGLNTVYFNQSGYFSVANAVTFNSKTAHMFSVFQLPTTGAKGSDNCFIGGTGGAGIMSYGAPTNGNQQNFLNSSIAWGTRSGSTTFTTGVSYQINGSISSGSMAFRKNRADDGTGSLSDTISLPTNAFGNQESSTRSTAYVGEVIVYSAPLSQSDRNLVENYLNAKWGV